MGFFSSIISKVKSYGSGKSSTTTPSSSPTNTTTPSPHTSSSGSPNITSSPQSSAPVGGGGSPTIRHGHSNTSPASVQSTPEASPVKSSAPVGGGGSPTIRHGHSNTSPASVQTVEQGKLGGVEVLTPIKKTKSITDGVSPQQAATNENIAISSLIASKKRVDSYEPLIVNNTFIGTENEYGQYQTDYMAYGQSYDNAVNSQAVSHFVNQPTSPRIQNIINSPQLQSANHSSQPTLLIHGRTPSNYGEGVVHYRESPQDIKQSLTNMEGTVSDKIPDVGAIENKQIEHVEAYPKTAKIVHSTFGMLPEPVYDFTEGAGIGTYDYVQQNPLKTTGWVGVGYVAGPIIGGVGRGAGLAAEAIPYGSKIVNAAKVIQGAKYIGPVVSNAPSIGMGGAFGILEYNRITSDVISDEYSESGMPLMRDPTPAEMGYRMGETIVIGSAITTGSGLYKYGGVGVTKIKNMFNAKPETVEEVAEAADMTVTYIKSFKTTEKAQPWVYADDILGSSKTTTKIEYGTVPESEISSGQLKRYFGDVQHQQSRSLETQYQYSITGPTGQTKHLGGTGTVEFIKKVPEPDDVVNGVQQVTLGDMSLSKVGTGATKVEYGGLSKDVLKKSTDDVWEIDVGGIKPDKYSQLERVKGISSTGYETPTTVTHIRGRITGTVGEVKAFDPLRETTGIIRTPDVPPQQFGKTGDLMESPISKLWGKADETGRMHLETRDGLVNLKQTGLDDYWSEAVPATPQTRMEWLFGHGRKDSILSLDKKTVQVMDSAKPLYTPKADDLKNTPMKPLYTSKDIPPSSSSGVLGSIETGSFPAGNSKGSLLIDDLIPATKQKSTGISADQIVKVEEAKIVDTFQSGGMLPDIKTPPRQSNPVNSIGMISGLTAMDSVIPQILHGEPIEKVKPIIGLSLKQDLAPSGKISLLEKQGLKFMPLMKLESGGKPAIASMSLLSTRASDPMPKPQKIFAARDPFATIPIFKPLTPHIPQKSSKKKKGSSRKPLKSKDEILTNVYGDIFNFKGGRL